MTHKIINETIERNAVFSNSFPYGSTSDTTYAKIEATRKAKESFHGRTNSTSDK